MAQNTLIIGVGPHAVINHLPALARLRSRGLVGDIIGFDIADASETIERVRRETGLPTHVYYTSSRWAQEGPGVEPVLPPPVARRLDDIAARHDIRSVVIACEPTYHSRYAEWALRRGLHTLIDKPTAMRPGASRSTAQARAIFDDYTGMSDAYAEALADEPTLAAVVLCQRRYHPLYRRVWDKIEDVLARTGCGVTSMQSFHADGQWRLPHELVELTYHSYNRGYGKIAHSGYHLIDYLATTVQVGRDPGDIDELEICATASRPVDYLQQLDWYVHDRCFSELPFNDLDVKSEIAPEVADHGEVDAFITLSFRREGRVVAMGSINLLHNGLSLREHPEANPDLYRGNGRLRHESHIIQQGPFQAIYIRSYRSGDVNRELDDVGGEAHLEVEVFRNNRLVPGWKGYEKLTLDDGGEVPCGDQQQAARGLALEEYVLLANGGLPPGSSVSDLRDHTMSTAILAGAYQSIAARAEGGNPMVSVPLPGAVRMW